jgi:hypothetical protein
MEKDTTQIFNKNALVINGCNKLGAVISRCLLQKDAKLLVPAGNIAELNEMKGYTRLPKPCKLIPFLTDMSDYERTLDVAQVVVEEYGQIDLIVAIFNHHSPAEIESGKWHDEADNNGSSFIPGTQAFLHLMKQDKGNRVYINVSYIDGDQCDPFSPLSQPQLIRLLQENTFKDFFAALKDSGIRYYHLFIDAELKENPEITGDYIIQLYNCNTKEPCPTLHSFCNDAWKLVKLK